MTLRFAAVLALALVLFRPSVAGAIWGNANTGTVISNAANNQLDVRSIPDGSGGAIMTWGDTRNNNSDIFAQRVNAWGQVQWAPDGAPVRVAGSQQTNPCIVPDGAGGAIIFYEHLANNGSTDIHAQRIDSSGNQLWLTGVLICTAMNDQLLPRAVPDGSGGAIVIWQDNRQGSNADADLFAQHVNSSGAVLWNNNGVGVSTASQKQTNARIIADTNGGVIIAWTDFRDGSSYSVFAQRLNPAGVPAWTSDGVPIVTGIGSEITPAIVSDDAGGAILAWDNGGGSSSNVWAQRINVAGVSQWNIGGVSVCAALQNQSSPQMIPDGSGGAIIAWQDLRDTVNFVDEDIYAQRINSSGGSLWTPNGNLVCAVSGQSILPQVISDGFGGAIVVWTDTRTNDYNIYAQRINPAGTRLWDPAGAPVTIANSGQTGPAPVTDTAGGVIVGWTDTRNGNFDVYANRITAGGITPTAVGDTPAAASVSLGQNRPNPFNPSTTIEYTLTARTPVTIDIFDAKGARVASLDEGMREPGTHRAVWNASPSVSSGVYFYRLAGAPKAESKKMVLVK